MLHRPRGVPAGAAATMRVCPDQPAMPAAIVEDIAGQSPWYAFSLLFAASILSTLDRAIVGLVSEPIKRDLALSDTALGFINGAGFVVFYILFGIPMARWADRGVRRSILALAMAVWSVMTAVSGLAQNFIQFVAARAGVAIGESAGTPTSLSLISDLFPPAKRMRAISLYTSAPFVGIVLGMPLIGWLVTHHGWRSAMVVFGLPGVALAAVIALTFREPIRGRFDPPSPSNEAPATLIAALKALATNIPFVLITAGMTINSLAAAAQAGFVPAYMQRTHGMTQLEIGLIMGPIVAGAAMLGILTGGVIAELVRKRTGRDTSVLVLFIAMHALSGFAMAVFLGADPRWLMLAGGAAQAFLNSLKAGPFVAIALSLVSPNMRGLAATMLSVIAVSLVGGALGPLFVGLISDALTPYYGGLALRYGLVSVCCGGVALSSIVFLFVPSRIARLERDAAAPEKSKD